MSTKLREENKRLREESEQLKDTIDQLRRDARENARKNDRAVSYADQRRETTDQTQRKETSSVPANSLPSDHQSTYEATRTNYNPPATNHSQPTQPSYERDLGMPPPASSQPGSTLHYQYDQQRDQRQSDPMRSSIDATGPSNNHNGLNMNDLNNKNLASNEESKFKQTYLGGGGRNSEDASAHQSNVASRYE